MKIISLLNMKGGVGKTTSALNIAKGLNNKNKKILVLDLDPQSNATGLLTMEKNQVEFGIESFLNKEIKDINSLLVNIKTNLDLLPATLKLATTEMELRLNPLINQNNIISSILDKLSIDYDYIIIDCPPIISLITINVILASDEIIIPVKPGKFSIEGASVTIDNIKKIEENFEYDKKYKLLFTMVDRNNIDKTIINNLINVPQYESKIRYQAKPITESTLKGEFVVDGKSNIGLDYMNLVEEIIK